MIHKIYHSKYFPRIFYTKPDGGKNSGVTAFFLIEWKIFFSIGLLRFSNGGRKAYHSHAFNALTWWLKGAVTEQALVEQESGRKTIICRRFTPSLIPKLTKRSDIHSVTSFGQTWALTIRGPWKDTWTEIELLPYRKRTLTHARKEV